ncbi:Acyl-CoA thioester hydrolase, YbgC/YbaW family [uncultured Paludibacter sp.]|nr:Acyl-CoA thioester hydrolase, YbgC/YbaW family [uncultured Paludibacter sp.]
MYIYELDFKVRDYECDLQGIVNNSNYQRYYEHTRHEFLLERGVSFADLHNEGIDAVVARIEIAFKVPLKSRDEFISKLYVSKDGVKYIFHQAIYRKSDNKLCSTAKVTTVVTINGKLTADFELFDKLCEDSKSLKPNS